MQFRHYPASVFQPFIIHRTSGTGDQGGSPIREHEMVAQAGSKEEAISMIEKLNKITGRTSSWCDWGYTYNINTNTEVGQLELKKFEARMAELEQDRKDHPELWEYVENPDGVKFHFRKNPEWDKAWSVPSGKATATFQIIDLSNDESIPDKDSPTVHPQ